MENETKEGANWGIKQQKQNYQTWWEKERTRRNETKNWNVKLIEVDKENLYILKIHYCGKRTVQNAHQGINVENNNRLLKLKKNNYKF